ncbi:M20/M25/M40 family metallo-hydrolase [Fusibacter tunisiensis]|uniref:Tripeptide aminopeptidase n=1 Tax=Fusibacter tunisiensis TaxID=1008308 RepID=A0ABS2MSE2_9FIRM|nr:M20/M25/M40 family metallo-hydrolase [Fusibacter tunisiensis]MBM7562319.1 tripeptide aminopeptidase [Fusibacter tunisiensis]
MINQERLVNAFMDYVRISSPTKQEGEFAKFISNELKSLGLEVTIDDAGPKVGSDTGNVIAKFKGNADAEPILFSCHMDTVSPGIDIKPEIRDGVIYSDGTTVLGGDDKAGIAAVLEAIRVIQENDLPHGDIEIAFSIYEEGGLHGAKNLDYSMFKSKKAFVLDSGGTPGQIITKGPAQDKIDVKVIGRPAHAGVAPEEGISAIMVASAAISRMKLLRIDSETTANIGTISGGTVTNIVTPEVNIKAEARSLNNAKLKAQSDHMVACFEEAAKEFGAKVDCKVVRMYSAFSVNDTDPIVASAVKACENIGLTPHIEASGGGSDTNIYNANGITAINFGIGERKPHTLEEHLHIKDLVNASKLVLELIKVHQK